MGKVLDAASNLYDAIYEETIGSFCSADNRTQVLLEESRLAMQEFVDRADEGETENTFSYHKFKVILKKFKETGE